TADVGELALAKRDVGKAVEILQKVGVSEVPYLAAGVLELQGDIEMRTGDHSAAQASFSKALSAVKQVFGDAHPLAAEAQVKLASAAFALGSERSALEGGLEAERIGREHLRFTARYLPERGALAYADKRPKGLDLALSIVAAQPMSDGTKVFDSV